jgi:hypothetical protein
MRSGSPHPPPSIELDRQSLADSSSSHTASTASTRQSSMTGNTGSSWWRRIAGGSSRPTTPSIRSGASGEGAVGKRGRTSFDARSTELGVH